jgi:phage shock protein C
MGPEYPPPAPSPPAPPDPRYPPPVPPSHPRRLTRSRRERMWAGVAGGMAEYFDLDPSLVRLLWVAATVVSGGLAVPLYILAWIILPRDDRPPVGNSHAWREWSDEFHSETERLAHEARRMADDVRDAGRGWRAPGAAEPPTADPATGKTEPTPSYTAPTAEEPWWQSERYVERHRHRGRHPRSTGVVLVALGVLLLAANAGFFSWIEWRTMWPLIFIGLGVILLARQSRWGR